MPLYMGLSPSRSTPPPGASAPLLAAASSSSAFFFITASMFKKPLLRPGVKPAAMPASVMNFGSTLLIASAVSPDRPLIRSATSPFVINPSLSPTKLITFAFFSSSYVAVPSTYTVLKQPGTLFSGTQAAGLIGGNSPAMYNSCLLRRLASSTILKAFVIARSSVVKPKGSAATSVLRTTTKEGLCVAGDGGPATKAPATNGRKTTIAGNLIFDLFSL
mmetsp:Transcript_31022/g.46039  ORF Transcript_31022/g.46039 Transcript_31022/m.46039 type:complete len:218 (-) Transcript_31022:87-740(-)